MTHLDVLSPPPPFLLFLYIIRDVVFCWLTRNKQKQDADQREKGQFVRTKRERDGEIDIDKSTE
jgi:hypothetical protein